MCDTQEIAAEYLPEQQTEEAQEAADRGAAELAPAGEEDCMVEPAEAATAPVKKSKKKKKKMDQVLTQKLSGFLTLLVTSFAGCASLLQDACVCCVPFCDLLQFTSHGGTVTWFHVSIKLARKNSCRCRTTLFCLLQEMRDCICLHSTTDAVAVPIV